MALNVELVIIAICWVLSAALLSIWLVHYYAHKHVSPVVRIVTFLSWLTCFCIPFVLPLDIQSDYHSSMKSLWTALYIIISIGCWAVAPWLKTYYDNGGFTLRDKLLYILWDEVKFYAVAILIGAGLILYLMIKESLKAGDVVGVLLALSNTFGLFLLTITLGYGVVNLPLSIFKSANRPNSLRFLLYKIGKLNEKITQEQDRLQQTHAYLEKIEHDLSPDLLPYYQILKRKCPSPHVYEFAHIGISHAIESFSSLEKIQKKAPQDLKYKHLISLHHIVILHRRSFATFQAEWYDTLKRYRWLNTALLLIRQYPTPKELPQSTLTESDPATFKSFPFSVLWTLPCCCCRRTNRYDIQPSSRSDMDHLDGTSLDSLTSHQESSEQFLASNSTPSPVIGSMQSTDSIYDRNAYSFVEDITGDNTDDNDHDALDTGVIGEDPYAASSTDPTSLSSSSSYHLKQQGGVMSRVSRFRLGAWLFGSRPPLTPGTIYYTLSWRWFQYVLYYQPVVHKIMAVLLGLLSLLVLWCEISIMIKKDLSPISLLTHLKNADPFVKLFLTIVPLVYIIICTYFTLFRLQISSYYHMHGPKKTGASSILWNVSFMLRMILPTAYNYFRMIRAEETAFASVIGTMEAIPLLGRSFNTYVPVLVVVIALFTAINCWSRFLRVLKIPHFDYSLADPESEQIIEDGRVLVDRDNARRTGQVVEHYRGKHASPSSSSRRKQNRSTAEKGDNNGGDQDSKDSSRSNSSRATQLRSRQNDDQAYHEQVFKSAQPYGSRSTAPSTTTGNSTASGSYNPRATRYKFHSEREKAYNIDDL